MRSLEDGLGIALFDRIGRETSLTPAGATLLQYVRQMEAIANDAIAALAPFGGQEGAELSRRNNQLITNSTSWCQVRRGL